MELKDLISPNDLDLGISIMKNGTLMLGHKIDEVKRFINFLTQKDQIFQYLTKSASDQQLEMLLSKVWHSPIQLPFLSLNHLNEAWIRLVSNKADRQQKAVTELPMIDEKTIASLTDFRDPFEDQMQTYLTTISSTLPASLEDILGDYGDSNLYFEQFSFILHLLQDGYLYFNKDTHLFTIGDTKHE